MGSLIEYRKLKNFEKVVEDTLKRHPETRNSDVKLTWYIIHLYYPEETSEHEGKHWISYRAMSLVREDKVKRARAKITNPRPEDGFIGKYLPDDQKVRQARKITEEAYRIYVGKNPEMRTVDNS